MNKTLEISPEKPMVCPRCGATQNDLAIDCINTLGQGNDTLLENDCEACFHRYTAKMNQRGMIEVQEVKHA